MVEWITTVIEQLGYPGIALLTLLEVVVPPIPSEIILPFSGFAASNSETLGLLGVAVSGTMGSVVGASVLYGLGYMLPPERINRWIERHGQWLRVDRDDVEKARSWFQQRGHWAVFVGRLIPGVRSYVSIPAGSARMNFPMFLLFTALGTGIWSLLLAWIGSVLGENYQRIGNWLDVFGWFVGISFVLSIIWWFFRKGRNQNSKM